MLLHFGLFRIARCRTIVLSSPSVDVAQITLRLSTEYDYTVGTEYAYV